MSQAEQAARVGYVLKVYPRFSETFVVTEMLAREQAGEDLAIFALRPTTDARFHPEIAQVQAPVQHLPRSAKLSDGWSVLARAHAELPDFGARFTELLPMLCTLEASEAVQGVELALQARRAGITHLHAHFASMAARVSRVASGLTGIPYSVTTHAKDLFHESVDRSLLADVLGHADHVVAISDYNLAFLRSNFPEAAGHTRLVRNGLDLERFRYTDPAPVRGPLKVAAVGRLVEKKGFGLLIEAAGQVHARGGRLEVRIAGDGELREELELAIAGAGLEPVVRLLGPRSQSEVRELLEWADVMAAPCVVGADGNADGLPTVLLEAMAMGVPALATDVTGIPEAIHSGSGVRPTTGVLLPAGDLPALVRALHEVASPDYPRVEVARAARALIEDQFDTTRQSRLLAGLQQGPCALRR
ncbi:MAG: glycosyltransferase [Actinomycetota bacterium]|nr:glycosyltransferase [Actinomycetota bacterium]MDQ3526589.1 glycosyltransferase [Actinomycetota bacterium]